ncbi:hypothetical protein C8J57DRAFT_1577585, partial [Mycena rebaudengoi]
CFKTFRHNAFCSPRKSRASRLPPYPTTPSSKNPATRQTPAPKPAATTTRRAVSTLQVSSAARHETSQTCHETRTTRYHLCRVFTVDAEKPASSPRRRLYQARQRPARWRCVAPASLGFSPSPTSPRILLRPTDTQRLACTFLLYSPFPSPPMHLTRGTETMAPYDLPHSPSTICASRLSSNIPETFGNVLYEVCSPFLSLAL